MLTRVTAVVLFSVTFGSSLALAQGRDGGLLESADADHDGKVTRQEFIEARDALFAKLDRNGDDVLDTQELQAARSAAKERFRERRQ
jgi:hypothetical protein